jgi:hypothetical protein
VTVTFVFEIRDKCGEAANDGALFGSVQHNGGPMENADGIDDGPCSTLQLKHTSEAVLTALSTGEEDVINYGAVVKENEYGNGCTFPFISFIEVPIVTVYIVSDASMEPEGSDQDNPHVP